MSKAKYFADTKNRLFTVWLRMQATGANDSVRFNFKRWINIYSLHVNTGSIQIGFPFEQIDEVDSIEILSGLPINNTVNNSRATMTLTGNSNISFYNPIITRSIVLTNTATTGQRTLGIMYK